MDTLATRRLQTLQIPHTLIILAATMLLPVLFHLIPPVSDVPMGARLLPLFYAPLIAVLLFRPHVGLIAAALAPMLNYLLTGRPEFGLVTLLSGELLTFSLIMLLALKLRLPAWLMVPVALLLAKTASFLLLHAMPHLSALPPVVYWQVTLANAIPGMLVLMAIAWTVTRYLAHKP
ncbi:MAG: hypothetical protein QNJ69_13350 [Gammaproteobacteria bacterium]|nr:hypothetical protein [Gammaproteobacteria bacterium]